MFFRALSGCVQIKLILKGKEQEKSAIEFQPVHGKPHPQAGAAERGNWRGTTFLGAK